MVKKSILVGFFLLVSYTIFVAMMPPQRWKAVQHQWQENIVKGENFIYDENLAYSNVIVGSSVSCRLVMDSLPETYNLALNGQSILDGLHVLLISNKIPKNVLIEMNFVFRTENEKFTKHFNSILFYPKKYIPSLRENKQPIAVLGAHLNLQLTSKIISQFKSSFLGKQVSLVEDKNLFSRLLQMEKQNYSQLPDEQLMSSSFEKLKEYVAALKKRNVNVIFFEIPVNDQLNYLPRATAIRNSFYYHFPPSEFDYISLPESEHFLTSDGVHLNETDALIYSSYLKRKLAAQKTIR